MNDRSGIFSGDNPIEIIRRWMSEARKIEINDPEAAALASVDKNGMPNVRMVLVKIIEKNSLLFFTNYTSAKANELNFAGKAALVFHWKSIRRQIRVRGVVAKEDGTIADDYYRSRSINSRLGAWASDQSSPLQSREKLETNLQTARKKHGDDPKRPKFWGGFRLTPLEIEFWRDGEHRLHDRFTWKRRGTDAVWQIDRLYP